MRARAFDGHLPRDGATVALVCRFCAGALPPSLLAAPEAAKCDYCGQPPALNPTLLALLKVMVTHPRALPPAVKRILRLWFGFAAVYLLLIGLFALLPGPAVRGEEYLGLDSARLARVEGGKQFYDVSARSTSFTISPRGNTFPYVSLQAWDFVDSKMRVLIPGQRMDLRVSLVREETDERRTQWLNFYDGAQWRPSPAYPESHAHATLSFFEEGRLMALPPGTYRIEITAATTEGGQLPARVQMEWTTAHRPMLGWFIVVANLGLWLLVFELRSTTRAPLQKTRLLNRRSILLSVVLLATLVEVIHPFDPFGDKSRFIPREAKP